MAGVESLVVLAWDLMLAVGIVPPVDEVTKSLAVLVLWLACALLSWVFSKLQRDPPNLRFAARMNCSVFFQLGCWKFSLRAGRYP